MRKRLPDFPSVVQVYAVIAVLFAGWTITAFLWRLSAWLLLLNLGEVLTVFSYALATNFLESLIVLLILLMAGALLPSQFLLDDFVVRGTILGLGLMGALMAFVASEMYFGFKSGLMLLIPPLMILMLTAFLIQRASNYQRVRSAAIWLSDRVIVFLFILVPLFAVASVYVIFRNVV